ncbi:MAG: hypothetical protein RBR54_05990 [Sulfurimonas sp.]|jgi:hypothetical protein|nr:hypothetical protein [Sulfurimonas sp.]
MRRAWFNGEKVRAEDAGSGAIGHCPFTNWQVKAHVGEIRQYWAYIGGHPELPPGYENETPWHAAWKIPMQDDSCEVIFGDNNEHRADIVGANGVVIELQHSPIDIRDVRERIRFYREESNRRVIWIVDAREYWKKSLNVDFSRRDGSNYPLVWKRKRQWVYHIAQNIESILFLDYNHRADKLLQVWVHRGELYGRFIPKQSFFMSNMNDVAKEEYKDYSQLCIDVWNDVN